MHPGTHKSTDESAWSSEQSLPMVLQLAHIAVEVIMMTSMRIDALSFMCGHDDSMSCFCIGVTVDHLDDL